MANAYALNYSLSTSGETFNAIWKLSRVMLSAGWRYKAGGNGQSGGTKDTSADLSKDTWSVGGAVNLTSAGRATGSGAGVSIGAASATTGLSVVTGLTGATASSIGDYLVVSGSTNSVNNGAFRITAQASTQVTIYNPAAIAETGNGALSAVENFGGAAASITTFSTTTSGQSTLLTVTGLSGLSGADVGRYLTLGVGGGPTASGANGGSFLIVSVLSASSCLIYNPGGVASDANSGSIQWVEIDPLQQVYPSYLAGSSGSGAWLDLQGPTMMLIPIGANVPTATFIRGENVTQTSTGAQGELRGVVVDASGGTGYLVIAPRVVGTGARASTLATYGWNNSAFTDTITGAFSAATVTTPANSTPRAFVRETLFWKGGTSTDGHVYHQCIDQATEATATAINGRFSTMATSGTVTAQLAPAGSAGGAPTSNGFPTTGTYCVLGTGGSGSGATGQAKWCGAAAPTSPGRAQIMCANAVEQQGVSADGSWKYAQSANAAGYLPLCYDIVDTSEDGDVDPYVHLVQASGNLSGTPNRTADTGAAGSLTDAATLTSAQFTNTNNHSWKGFRRRGQSLEAFAWFSTAILADVSGNGATTNASPLNVNNGNPDQVATAPVTTYVREPIWIWLTPFTAQNNGARMRKGTPRWLWLCQGGSVNRTLDTEAWIILSSSALPLVAGPYDGATTPVF